MKNLETKILEESTIPINSQLIDRRSVLIHQSKNRYNTHMGTIGYVTKDAQAGLVPFAQLELMKGANNAEIEDAQQYWTSLMESQGFQRDENLFVPKASNPLYIAQEAKKLYQQ